MNTILLACDLDNTLLYSARHLPTEAKICVEHYEGREQGFFTWKTVELLRQIRRKVNLVPLTTRSVAQYRRIEWPPDCEPELALTTNGAILLTHGEIDARWQAESQQKVKPYFKYLAQRQQEILHLWPKRTCRLVDESYLFCAAEDETAAGEMSTILKSRQKPDPLLLGKSGRKLYFFPPELDKGTALKRLQSRLGSVKTLAAGDSLIDLPMLRVADMAFVPNNLLAEKMPQAKLKLCQQEVFAEEMLAIINNNFDLLGDSVPKPPQGESISP